MLFDLSSFGHFLATAGDAVAAEVADGPVGLSHSETLSLLLALAVLLGAARLMGELATKLRQPAVLGEILAGILLGPTLLGHFLPDISAVLFPATGAVPIALEGFTTIAITLFLLVAGMEVDLSSVTRQGKAAFKVGFIGMLPPLLIGFALAFAFPTFMGAAEGSDRLVFALFLGTALSISALPVIAKILMDLGVFRSDIGMLVVASAILRDIAGWNIFAVILGMAGAAGGGPGLGVTLGGTVLFVGFMLTIGRWIIHKSLPALQAHLTWPGGVLGVILTGGLICAAFTEWLGIHAIFGAFIFGVALGDSGHLRAHTRAMMEHFISFIFAPIFFASIGLKVNFIQNFNPLLTLVILVVGCAAMVYGSAWAAKFSGFPKRESLAIGIALNARGVMEIILGVIALKAGLIGNELFVALVVLAIFTSATSGSLMQLALKPEKKVRLLDFLRSRAFIPNLTASVKYDAISELADAICQGTELKPREVAAAVWERERQQTTGIDGGLAVPHARLPGLKTPLVAVGISKHGIDFDTKDGRPAYIIFLILTPEEHGGAQLSLLADIGRYFHDGKLTERCVQAVGYTEFLAVLKSEGNGGTAH